MRLIWGNMILILHLRRCYVDVNGIHYHLYRHNPSVKKNFQFIVYKDWQSEASISPGSRFY